MRIIVGSQNPAKLEAVSVAFASFFPEVSFEVQAVIAPSGVSPQPMSDAETLLGATNRARTAREIEGNADFWLGIEGGLQPVPGEPVSYLSYCWVVVLGRQQAGRARSASYELPKEGILEGTTTSPNVDNPFDEKPSFINRATGTGQIGGAGQGSFIGRYVSVSLEKKF